MGEMSSEVADSAPELAQPPPARRFPGSRGAHRGAAWGRWRRSPARPPRADAGESAAIERAMARLVAGGYLVYGLLFAPDFADSAAVRPWLPAVVVVTVILPGVALGAATWTRWWPRALPALTVALLVGYLLGAAVWTLAVTDAGADVSPAWALEFGGLPALAWILRRPLYESLAVVAVGKSASAVVLAAPFTDGFGKSVVIDALFSFLFMSTCTVLAHRVVHAGRLVDDVRLRVSRTLAESLRSAERARLDALIHDRVLATLIGATAARPDPRLPGQARDALDALDALAAPTAGAAVVSGPDLIAHLRRDIASVEPEIPVTVVAGDDADGLRRLDVPAPAAAALAEATGEAVRNALQHAGPDADIAAVISGDRTGVRITVVDNGVGFVPEAVPRGRLGVDLSIRRRVEGIPGGRVLLASAADRGTTVQLSWAAPQ